MGGGMKEETVKVQSPRSEKYERKTFCGGKDLIYR